MADSKGRIILQGDPNQKPEWEGVLDDLEIESLPIRHLSELTLNLQNKKRIIIDVPRILTESLNPDQAAQRVNNIIREHGESLTSIDFKVNMGKLQNQISEARNAFTKKVNKTIKRKNAEAKKKGKKQ